ncbi:MAG: cysteine desulfurase [Gemmatimonadetes bacterium]|nr:cysteine desulfurase [Gemmatimonadota bacterium]
MTQSVYLDNAATTPIRPEVLEAMMPYLTADKFGNPSSAHTHGRAAKAGVEGARRQVATALGCDAREVIFTSGGTECDNLAILGGAFAARAAGRPFRVAVTSTDHKAMLAAAHAVEHLGGEAIVLPVDRQGAADLEAVDAALAKGIGVLGTMWVNNETGVIQDVAALGARCAAAGTPFHVDAVQALGKIQCRMGDTTATFLAVSGHKIGGPKGIGALVVKNREALESLLHGGGQQWGIRPGTENVPGIVGLGRAAELAVAEVGTTSAHVASLRDELERCLRERIPDLVVNGADAVRAPHVSNVTIPGTDSSTLLMHLDLDGIACSAASACSTGAAEPSHVLIAMGLAHDLAASSLRFSFGKQNTKADVAWVVEILPEAVSRARQVAGALGR